MILSRPRLMGNDDGGTWTVSVSGEMSDLTVEVSGGRVDSSTSVVFGVVFASTDEDSPSEEDASSSSTSIFGGG